MKKANVEKILMGMIERIELKMKDIEDTSRVQFYHQGSSDALKIALDMVKSIDSESTLFNGDRNDGTL